MLPATVASNAAKNALPKVKPLFLGFCEAHCAACLTGAAGATFCSCAAGAVPCSGAISSFLNSSITNLFCVYIFLNFSLRFIAKDNKCTKKYLSLYP